MLRKKVCLVGSFGVGKTSLVARFVEGIFSDTYLSTIGVKIDRKPLTIDGKELTILLWDMAGEEKFERLQTTYLRGAAGVMCVADGTRKETLMQALDFANRVAEVESEARAVLLVNKSDLESEWEAGDRSRIADLAEGREFFLTSAKTGENVEAAFAALARQMISDA